MASRELGEKQVFAITVVIVGAVLAGVSVLAFLSYSSYSALVREKAEFDEKIEAHRVVMATREKIEAQIEASETNFSNVKQYLPTDGEVAQLLKALTDKCIEAKLVVARLQQTVQQAQRVKGQAQKTDAEKIIYKGEFSGSFHSAARFVGMVEDWVSFRRFVSITDLKIDAAQQGLVYDQGNQPHKITMTLEFYKYQEPQAKPTPPAKGGAAATAKLGGKG